jgi:hypothetical protein
VIQFFAIIDINLFIPKPVDKQELLFNKLFSLYLQLLI